MYRVHSNSAGFWIPPVCGRPAGSHRKCRRLVGLSHVVVDRFPPVQTDDHIAHFLMSNYDDSVVEQHAVGGQREPEILVTFFFSAAPIGNQFFHNVEVEQRFAAEEIHFQIAPGCRSFR